MDTQTQLMLAGIGIGFLSSLLTVLVIRKPFIQLLNELSRSEARGQFWAVVGILTILLIGAQASLPTDGIARALGGKLPILGLATQLRYTLIGLLASVLLISFVLVSYINRLDVNDEIPRIPWEAAER